MKLRSAWRVTTSTMMGDQEVFITNGEMNKYKDHYQRHNPQRVFIMTDQNINDPMGPGNYSVFFPPF